MASKKHERVDDPRLKVIGKRFADARKKYGATQEKVARAINVSAMTISRYERGDTMPDTDKVIALADLYGCQVGWLLGRDVPAPTADSHVEKEDVMRAVDEFVASLDDDDLAEFRENDEEWSRGLAFKDLRSTLGVDVTSSLIRRLWGERRGQRSGKLRPPPRIDVEVRLGRVKLENKKRR